MLNKVASGIDRQMRLNGVAPPPIGVIVYALDIVVNTLGIVLLTIIIGLLTGNLSAMMACLGALAMLRFVSGGVHLRNNITCITASSITIAIIPFIDLSDRLNVYVTAAALIVVAIKAPSNYDKHARIPRKYYPLMKVIACIIVGVNLLIASDVLALTYIIQAVTLLPSSRGGETT